VRGVEGSSDLFVRGGTADQNLVLLDDVPIYNTSHLFGFVSVLNPDVLQYVESVNGGFPAHYGGRLSSILRVETLSDIPQRTTVSGNIGILASRLALQQPIAKEKIGFWVSARRTYVDQAVKLVKEELPYFFYDLNAKILVKPTKQDDFEVSFYGGIDVLDIFRDRNNDGDGLLTSYQSGNNSQARAQLYSGGFSMQWSIMSPLSDTEYIGKTSVAGMRVGFTKFVGDRFSLGIEGGYNSLNEYIPRKTYEYPGGAYTTDFYNYMYYYTLMGNVHYYLMQTDRVMPYTSLSMGVAFCEYKLYYNIYGTSDNQTGFVTKPEIGIILKAKDYSNWAFKPSICYEYATVKSSQLAIDNFSGVGFQIGVIFFTD
jgi:hypothetical protein